MEGIPVLHSVLDLKKWSSFQYTSGPISKRTSGTSDDSDSDSSSDASSDLSSEKKPVLTQTAGDLSLPDLPYKSGDLHDIISSNTIDAHLKLHKVYVDRTRELVQGTKLADMELDDVVKAVSNKKGTPIYKNANQAWNHAFYWMSISPPGQDTAPTGDLANAVDAAFGDVDGCREKLIKASLELFGSGYVWLVNNEGKVGIMTTPNGTTPFSDKGNVPLICVDVWEHAYYLDYESDRASYVDSTVKQLLNWGFADKNWEDKSGW
jgi:Fe-Mn family superoxide dismutase